MTNWKALDAIRKAQESDQADDRRVSPRFGCRDAVCGRGRVIDVSRTGVLIRTKAKPPRHPTMMGLVLESPTGRIQVAAEPIRCRPVGRGEYEIAFRLADPEAAVTGGLFVLAWNPDSTEYLPSRRRAG